MSMNNFQEKRKSNQRPHAGRFPFAPDWPWQANHDLKYRWLRTQTLPESVVGIEKSLLWKCISCESATKHRSDCSPRLALEKHQKEFLSHQEMLVSAACGVPQQTAKETVEDIRFEDNHTDYLLVDDATSIQRESPNSLACWMTLEVYFRKLVVPTLLAMPNAALLRVPGDSEESQAEFDTFRQRWPSFKTQLPDPLTASSSIDHWHLFNGCTLSLIDVGMFYGQVCQDKMQFKCPLCDATTDLKRVGFANGFWVVKNLSGNFDLLKPALYIHETCTSASHTGTGSVAFTALHPRLFDMYPEVVKVQLGYDVTYSGVRGRTTTTFVCNAKDCGISLGALEQANRKTLKALILEKEELVAQTLPANTTREPFAKKYMKTSLSKPLCTTEMKFMWESGDQFERRQKRRLNRASHKAKYPASNADSADHHDTENLPQDNPNGEVDGERSDTHPPSLKDVGETDTEPALKKPMITETPNPKETPSIGL